MGPAPGVVTAREASRFGSRASAQIEISMKILTDIGLIREGMLVG